jgi:hypothetical protein
MRSTTPNREAGGADREEITLPEETEHVVVKEQPNRQAPEYRMPASRLQQYDDVDLSEYVDDEEKIEKVTVVFEPGDEIPVSVAADGTYDSFTEMFACFDADGNRLDGNSVRTDQAVRQWEAQN